MKTLLPVAIWAGIVVLASGSQAAKAQDDSTASGAQVAPMPDDSANNGVAIGNIGAGSRVVVGDTAVVIPANEEFLHLQDGAFTALKDLDQSKASCRLHLVKSPLRRQLLPGRKLIVTNAQFNDAVENATGHDILFFDRDRVVDQLQCKQGNDAKGHITVGELKAILGQLFKLVEAPPAKALRRAPASRMKSTRTV